MNIPRFNVYLDPRPLTHREAYYAPPKDQTDLVTLMTHSGYFPCVNTESQPRIGDIQRTNGFVYLPETKQLVQCKAYTGGKILCMQWYLYPLTDMEMDTIIDYMKPFYGVEGGFKEPSETYHTLVDAGCFQQVEVKKSFTENEFIGSHVFL